MTELRQRGEAVAPRHHEIERHEVRAELEIALDRLIAIAGLGEHFVTGAAQDLSQERPDQQVVVDDEDSRHGVGYLISPRGHLARPAVWLARDIPGTLPAASRVPHRTRHQPIG